MSKKKFNKLEQEAFRKMTQSIHDYMALQGWNLVVIGSPKILKEIGSLRYNYVFEVGFTGKYKAE